VNTEQIEQSPLLLQSALYEIFPVDPAQNQWQLEPISPHDEKLAYKHEKPRIILTIQINVPEFNGKHKQILCSGKKSDMYFHIFVPILTFTVTGNIILT